MKGRIGRRLGATSVVAVLVLAGGMLVARADSVANFVQFASTLAWNPSSTDPSGAVYIPSGPYLLVVDTNLNDPDSNGWEYIIGTGQVTSRGTGVDEPTGVDYHAASNKLFISSDRGTMTIVTDFDTINEDRTVIDTEALGSFDTEDPAYDPVNDVLYWVDGADATIFWIDPVDGVFGNGDDVDGSFSIDAREPGADWEALEWDPALGNLLVGSNGGFVYEITKTDGSLVNTIDATGVSQLSLISGMGLGPASYDLNIQSMWVTDRDTSRLIELTIDGTTPPTTTTTTPATTTTTSGGSTTTTTSSTTTTTTPATTTTTSGGSTTTTTMGTTTTTIPGTTTTTVPPNPGGNPFIDDDGSVFENSIEWLAAQGITQGCNPPLKNRFCPNDRVTRGQMATFLVRALHYPSTNNDWFVDDEGHIFENAINRLREAGVTQGCNPPDNTRFCPDAFVTRGQMAAFLVRAFGYSAGGSTDYFVDDNGHIFETAINRLRAAGVTLGCNPPTNNRYCPNDYVTRGQMAAFLKRALEG